MKRIVIWIVAIIACLSLIGIFGLSGCKEAADAEETAKEEMMEEEAMEEEQIAEEVVAEEQELYIFVSINWSHPVWQQAKHGGVRADEYFGDELKVEFTGPAGDDTDAMFAALEAAVAKNPNGIVYLPWGLGEGDILTEYHDNGGLIAHWVGIESTGEWPVDVVVGIDNISFGQEVANWAMEEAGDSFKYAIMTVPDNPHHQNRVKGINSILDEQEGIEFVGPLVSEGGTPEEARASATSFIAANPDVDVFLSTAAMSGAAWAQALKEAGYSAGEKVIIGADEDPDLVEFIKDGWIVGSVGYSFALDIFYCIASMHFINDKAVNFTNDDEALGFVPAPHRQISPFIRFTEATADLISDLPQVQ